VPTLGCVSGGTLLYKQDFGGNNVGDSNISDSGFLSTMGRSDFPFSKLGTGVGNPYYSLTKNGYLLYPQEYHYNSFDHTHIGDSTRGYFMFAHPSYFQINKVIYETEISNLCDDMTLSFSAWFMSVNTYCCGGDLPQPPKIEMQMVSNTGIVLATSGDYTIPRGNNWQIQGFDFVLPSGVTYVKFRILNRQVSGSGNDLGLDDIEIRFCAPPVTTALPDSIAECERMPLTLRGAYNDDGTFGNNLSCRWEYSTTGNINIPTDWSPVGSDSSSTTGSISSSYTIPSLALSDAGYYRLVVSKSTSINNWACRAASKIIKLTVKERPNIYITGSNSICVGTTTQLSPTTGGNWTSTEPAVAMVTNDGIVTGLSTGFAKFVFTFFETGCIDTTGAVSVDIFPIVGDISAENTVCVNEELSLSCSPSGGVWSLSNNNAQIINNQVDNPVRIKGITEGQVYVTYTLGAGMCQSKSTFLLKIVPASQPTIKIGFE